MLISITANSAVSRASTEIAAFPSSARITSQPSEASCWVMTSSRIASSSTTRTLRRWVTERNPLEVNGIIKLSLSRAT